MRAYRVEKAAGSAMTPDEMRATLLSEGYRTFEWSDVMAAGTRQSARVIGNVPVRYLIGERAAATAEMGKLLTRLR